MAKVSHQELTSTLGLIHSRALTYSTHRECPYSKSEELPTVLRIGHLYMEVGSQKAVEAIKSRYDPKIFELFHEGGAVDRPSAVCMLDIPKEGSHPFIQVFV